MEVAFSTPSPIPAAGGERTDSEVSAKRRKIRKGTRSCWECKRRKIRCTFDQDADAVCDGCQRRGTTCLSQEFPEDQPHGGGRAREMDRIVRVEALVEQLVKKVGSGGGPRGGDGASNWIGARVGGTAASVSPPGEEVNARLGIPTPDDSCSESTRVYTLYNASADGLEDETVSGSNYDTTPSTRTSSVPRLGKTLLHPAGKYEKLSLALHAQLPSQEDANIICAAAGTISGYLQQSLTRPYSLLEDWGMESLKDMARLPPPTAHPVLLAKKLLSLAIFLQYLHPDHYSRLSSSMMIGGSPHATTLRMADAAIRLVTTNDELAGSVDGLECVMMEGVFHSNIGNLRRAWVTIRRAMVIAQLMGLHRGPSSHQQPLKVLDPTRRIYPSYMWFRILFVDRWLSLMLGLPLGSVDATIASEAALAAETPIGRLERMHCVIASRILERNERGVAAADSYAVTQQIDMELQRVAKIMPGKWWLTPQLAAITDQVDMFHSTVRLTDQLFHYSALILVHLPYMLRFPPGLRRENRASGLEISGSPSVTGAPGPMPGDSSSLETAELRGAITPDASDVHDNGGGWSVHASHCEFEYSKFTCVSASREVLTRFVTFRSINRIAYCCRAVDFFALMAAMTLLLAHLDSHSVQPSPASSAQKNPRAAGSSAGLRGNFAGAGRQLPPDHLNYSANFLAHSRLGDRAMMEQVLENMDDVSRFSQDVVSRRSAEVLRLLLQIEAEAADGTAVFTTEADSHGGREVQDGCLLEKEGHANDLGYDGRSANSGAGRGPATLEKGTGTMRLCIPYFGTIKIAREGTISREVPESVLRGEPYVDMEPQNRPQQQQSDQQQQMPIFSGYDMKTPGFSRPTNGLGGASSTQQQHGSVFAGSVLGLVQQQPQHDPDQLLTGVAATDGDSEFGTNYIDETLRQNLSYPGLTASVDDWAFQGVDMAFFESLMKGAGTQDEGTGDGGPGGEWGTW